MKKTFKQKIALLCTLGTLLIGTLAFAQAPQKFNYQGIARDLKGNPMSKQQMALKLTVLPTADATVAEYEETQLITTNEFGLYTLQIGNGTAITGDMKSVKWETGSKYIKVAIDAKGGSNYVDAGTSQLLSVPYALYADKAGTSTSESRETRLGAVSTSAAGTGTVNFLTKFTAANTIFNSQIFDNGAQIGIGTTTPSTTAKVHISSATGTQPMIFESPQGVHCLFREGGVNRGYFGSFVGSGAAQGYPTPVGTSNDDFDIGTSSASVGKLHLVTNTTPRLTITPTTGLVGIGTTTPAARLDVVGGSLRVSNSSNSRIMTYDPSSLNDLYFSGGNANITTGANNSVINMQQWDDTKLGVGNASPNAKLDVVGKGINGTSSRGSLFGVQGVCDSNGIVPLIPIPSAGVYGSSNGTSLTNGVYGTMYNTGCTNCNAISGAATNGNVGVKAIGTGTGTIALDVAGPVRVSGTASSRFAQTITQGATSTYLDVPTSISNSATDILIVTSVWQGQYITSGIQIWWTGTKWQIFRGDLGSINIGEKFNIIAIKN